MSSGIKPLLIYDGDCNFCRRWIGRWKFETGSAIEYVASQSGDPRVAKIPPEKRQASVWLIESDGGVFGGAEAVFRSLAHAPGRGLWLWAYRRVPGFAAASEAFYRIVASRRVFFSKITHFFWGEHLEPPTYLGARWLFLRGLGAIFFIAFLSLRIQILGLVGQNGILPAADFLKAVAEHYGPERFHLLPTFFWLGASDAELRGVCAAGIAASALLAVGIAPAWSALACWALYLSLVAVGRDFLSFQWDILLLETGFLAVFLSPHGLWPRAARERLPSGAALWAVQWLLFRLMFESGAVKLLSGDPTWRSLTALYFHYETQPLPTWIAWYAHHWPPLFQRVSVALVFAIELAVPFLIWLPRRAKIFAFFAWLFLQVLIAATGNYCFFNLLAVLLAVPLLDDAFLSGLRRRLSFAENPRPTAAPARLAGVFYATVALFLGGTQLASLFSGRMPSGELGRAAGYVQPFFIANRYGLFAVMTTTRPEIIVEGSDDGRNWKEFSFRWKPGDLTTRPRFVAPHQPRLDWQMWFAALGRVQDNPWFVNFLGRILQGSPDVMRLLAPSPFPDGPPRFVRARFYQYHFSARGASGWWRRELQGAYCPTLSLRR